MASPSIPSFLPDLAQFSADPFTPSIAIQLAPISTIPSILAQDSSISVVLLLDISVRNIEDISKHSVTYTFLDKYLSKLSHAKQSIKEDKFLYTYDIGMDKELKVSLARIPLLMYQKLDLAKQIVSGLSGNSVVVHALTENGDVIMDPDMASAIVAAMQTSRFSMPSFKKSTGSTSIPTAVTSTAYFVEVDSSDATPSIEYSRSDQTTEALNLVSQVIGELGTIGEIGEIGGSTPILSSLEQAMLDASNKRNQLLSATSPTTPTTPISPILAGDAIKALLHTEQCVTGGTNLARYLACLPPNFLSPSTYAAYIRELASAQKWYVLLNLYLLYTEMACIQCTSLIFMEFA